MAAPGLGTSTWTELTRLPLSQASAWPPLTESTSEKPWTIDSVDEARAALFAKSDGTIPPFFFPSPE